MGELNWRSLLDDLAQRLARDEFPGIGVDIAIDGTEDAFRVRVRIPGASRTGNSLVSCREFSAKMCDERLLLGALRGAIRNAMAAANG